MEFLTYGHPILRQRAKKVESITPEIKQLITDMLEFIKTQSAQGLAAPQLGYSLAIALVSWPIYDETGKYVEHSPMRVIINPVLSNPSIETWIEEEGCMSLPKLRGDVERPFSIILSGMDENGKEFTEELRGWPAKVVMHENDHLNGVLYIDRMSPQDRKALEPELKAIKAKTKTKFRL